jgi:hypothetical protein
MKLFGCIIHSGIVILLVCGCSSFRTDMGQPLRESACAFTNGQSRVGTVIAELGPPNRASSLTDGFVFLYEYSRVKEFQLGVSVNYSFLRYFKFVHAWNNLQQEATMLVFDNDGVLRAGGTKKWKEKLGGGNAVQFLVVVMSLSDVAHLLLPADAHDWGQELLGAPPVVLNSGQSLSYGQHGLEQRISPDFVGQNTLEMEKGKTDQRKKQIKRDYQAPYTR